MLLELFIQQEIMSASHEHGEEEVAALSAQLSALCCQQSAVSQEQKAVGDMLSNVSGQLNGLPPLELVKVPWEIADLFILEKVQACVGYCDFLDIDYCDCSYSSELHGLSDGYVGKDYVQFLEQFL